MCTKGGACQMCGTTEAVAGSKWVTVECQGGPLQGNQVQLKNPTIHLIFCEMKVFGYG